MEDYNLYIFYIRLVKSCLLRGKMTHEAPACSQNVLNLKRFFILTSGEIICKMIGNSGKEETGMNRCANRRHVAIAVVCAVMVLSMLLSSAYLAHEAACHHSCVGEDCPVCRFIAQVGQLRRDFGLALLALLAACFAVAVGRASFAPAAAYMPPCSTLVGRKIRLND